jgi:cytochrome oxidase Cu insertion factor (SCO1/SenC/PrrC family)
MRTQVPGMIPRLARQRPPGSAGAAGGGREPGNRHDGPAGRRRTRRAAIGVLATAIAAAAGTASYTLTARTGQGAGRALRPSGIPASIPTSLANLMALDSLPRTAAPGFTLTDQAGRTMALQDLRGKVVVLEFMDPHCTDICPIVSQEFVDAYHDLGPVAGKVVFAAVNVNPYFLSQRSVLAFSQEQRLTSIPGWHFFTGPLPALRRTWHDYNVAVQAPSRNADVIHTSAIYFIDRQGMERYLASPEAAHTRDGTSYLPAGQLAEWGHGIALLARSLVRQPGSRA